jgi:hypothetical protein
MTTRPPAFDAPARSYQQACGLVIRQRLVWTPRCAVQMIADPEPTLKRGRSMLKVAIGGEDVPSAVELRWRARE